MKLKAEHGYVKSHSPFSSKSTTSSHTSLNLSKFQFERPLGLIWKVPAKKRNASSDNVTDRTDTCMFDEEKLQKSAVFLESEIQTESTGVFKKELITENTELVREVKSLRKEIDEIKVAVRELKVFQREVQGYERPIEVKASDIGKKVQRPPLPLHRVTKSNSFM